MLILGLSAMPLPLRCDRSCRHRLAPRPWLAKTIRCRARESGKKKAHKHKHFCPVGLRISPDLSQGQTGFVPGTNPVKNWDTPGFSPYFTQWKPDFTGFFPGTNPFVPGTIPGQRAAQKVYVKKVYVPFLLARES